VSVPRVAIASVVVNALPFDRKANIRQSLSLCKGLLGKPGERASALSEGTRTTTGEMGEFKPGIGLLLADTACLPVVPCYVDGAYRAWPKGRWLPWPYRVRLAIGEPRNYSHLKRGKRLLWRSAKTWAGRFWHWPLRRFLNTRPWHALHWADSCVIDNASCKLDPYPSCRSATLLAVEVLPFLAACCLPPAASPRMPSITSLTIASRPYRNLRERTSAVKTCSSPKRPSWSAV